MKYIVYITINTVNLKYYIGVHSTENPLKFDYYLGCGAYSNKPSSYNKTKLPLHAAILKYGPSKFKRYTLKIFDSLEEALNLEKNLVDEECVKNTNTYNCVLGGGAPPIHYKKVYQYNLDGTLVKIHNSIIEAMNAVNATKDSITKAVNSKTSYKLYFWSFEEKIELSKYTIFAIKQYSSDGILLNVFESAKHAAIKLDFDSKAINGAVYGKYKLHGYFFLHWNEDINDILNNKLNIQSNAFTKVFRYDINGEFIKSYDSISDVKKEFPKANHGNIIRAIKNGTKSLGFRWGYLKVDNILTSKSNASIKPVKKIAQYDLDGNLIKIWNTLTECRKSFPNLLRVIRGERKHCNGYTFKFV